MATDPPALDLLTIRGRVEAVPGFLERQGLPETSKDLCALLAAYDTQAARLAAQQPVVDAVLKLSTYSRETVDDGVRRIVEVSDEYEEWLLEHPDAH